MDTHINFAVITGQVAQLPTRSDETGKPVTRFTVMQDEGQYKTFIPIECYGQSAEACLSLVAGQLVGVEGKLVWRATTLRSGEKRSGLLVLARSIKALQAQTATPA